MTIPQKPPAGLLARPIKGFENSYAVTKEGIIISLSRKIVKSNGVMMNITGGIIKLSTTKDGYQQVILRQQGKYKHKLVHRLVAETYLVQPPGKIFVNHRNGNKQDNRVQNLEWVDHAENMQHASVSGLIKFSFGKQNGNATALVDKTTGEYWGSITEAATHFGVKPETFKTRLKRNYYPSLLRIEPPKNTLGKTRRTKKRESLPRRE
jgi:hypothetical protein